MKRLLKKIVPLGVRMYYRSTRLSFDILKDYFDDFKNYRKNSASLDLNTKEKLQAFLVKEYHAVEKGLALPVPRPGFGVERISNLMEALTTYQAKYGKDKLTDITICTLKEYLDFDDKHNRSENYLKPKLVNLLESYSEVKSSKLGGTTTIKKSDIASAINFDFRGFFISRHSVRDFMPGPVDTSVLLDAINIAKFTPSVCNRQAWKFYLIEDSNQILKAQLLNIQNGNKGFGDKVSSILVVTGKLSSFFSYERNQVYIDAGMIAMSIILSLHSKGLGTCCLNLSYTAKQRHEFNKIMNVDDDCVPIMFIAVGHLKDEYKVAISHRKDLDELVSIK